MSVAVVTTCFNEADWIDDAVQSVLKQTVAARQHIVVDDGSTDASQKVLQRYMHLTVLTVTNRGMPAARTAGLLALRDDIRWVVYLDGDDWLEPNFIEECLQHSKRADVVVPALYRHPNGNRPMLPTVRHPTEEQLWERCHGASCGMIRRRMLIQAGGFHPATGGDCDWDMWIDLVRRGARFAYAAGTHYHYRIRPGSYSRTDGERLQPVHLAEMRRHHLCAR